jgi:hypothetical protein
LGRAKALGVDPLSKALAWEGFFTRYAAAFDALDVETITSFYHVPCLSIRAAEVAALSTRSAVLANMTSLVATHRSRGCERAHFLGLRAVLLDPGAALVSVPWTIGLLDASSTQFRNTYERIETAGEWRIVVSSMHESGSVNA